ncbi:MAG: hypothetical protein ACTSRP_13800 [Candidatus Helarchaeota archaeon]
MGLLSKIKEFFVGKPLETFKDIERDFNKLAKKYNIELIVLAGIASSIKGYPLIYSTDDENISRIYSAKIPQIIDLIEKFYSKSNFKELTIKYEDSQMYLEKILNNIAIFILSDNDKNILNIKQWIDSNLQRLISIFGSK